MNNETELMIKLPSQLFIEGNFKTFHSINIESNFTGILLSKNKVITIKAGTPVASIIPISLSELNKSSITMHNKEVPNLKHDEEYMKKMQEFSLSKNGFTNWYRDGLDQYGNVVGQHETKKISLYVIEGEKNND